MSIWLTMALLVFWCDSSKGRLLALATNKARRHADTTCLATTIFTAIWVVKWFTFEFCWWLQWFLSQFCVEHKATHFFYMLALLSTFFSNSFSSEFVKFGWNTNKSASSSRGSMGEKTNTNDLQWWRGMQRVKPERWCTIFYKQKCSTYYVTYYNWMYNYDCSSTYEETRLSDASSVTEAAAAAKPRSSPHSRRCCGRQGGVGGNHTRLTHGFMTQKIEDREKSWLDSTRLFTLTMSHHQSSESRALIDDRTCFNYWILDWSNWSKKGWWHMAVPRKWWWS